MPLMVSLAPFLAGAARAVAPIVASQVGDVATKVSRKQLLKLGQSATRGDLIKAGLLGAGMDMLAGYAYSKALPEDSKPTGILED